jgi:hypothetical protein
LLSVTEALTRGPSVKILLRNCLESKPKHN